MPVGKHGEVRFTERKKGVRQHGPTRTQRAWEKGNLGASRGKRLFAPGGPKDTRIVGGRRNQQSQKEGKNWGKRPNQNMVSERKESGDEGGGGDNALRQRPPRGYHLSGAIAREKGEE